MYVESTLYSEKEAVKISWKDDWLKNIQNPEIRIQWRKAPAFELRLKTMLKIGRKYMKLR